MAREIDEWLRGRAQELKQNDTKTQQRPTQAPVVDVAKSKLADRRNTKKIWLIACITLVIVAAGLFAWLHNHNKGFFPATVKKNTSFDLYYPEPKKLPQGYVLDPKTISSNGQAVIYAIDYGNGQRIVFTVQKKPSIKELDTFYNTQLPKHDDMLTDAGKATTATLNGKTFASIPTKTNSWLLITAPKDIDPNNFAQVLEALKK